LDGMKRAAIISAILDDPRTSQRAFNEIVHDYNAIVRGRMGIPFDKGNVALIALTVVGEMDMINGFTGKLGRIKGVTVKASFSPESVQTE
jgi:putative iron-only hydrogenase system regulator